MTTAHLPDFEHTLAIAQGSLEAPELAECHGVACGLLCRLPQSSLDAYVGLLDMLELVSTPGTGLKMSLEELLNSSRKQLADEDMGLRLWLPDENEILEERTMALSQWCSGFLAGLGSSGDDGLKAMSDDANEALADLQQFAKADVADTTESEDDENAYTEIVEYIRVVILMIREDLRGPDGQDLIH
ncbi:MAG: UPF0149 family protein YgfB [Gammaproteobacteria bacterium]|nr:MAG: UPF0149 family protein YgfB [Gammaproteobacteria bacterium]